MSNRVLTIEYADPDDLSDVYLVEYSVLGHAVASRWVKKLQAAHTASYAIDHPDRFYGFNSYQHQVQDALHRINQCVDIINQFKPIVDRKLTDINDQDTLNYLHHIFEVYHGLLDKPTKFFLVAPKLVQQALSDLNICVHRCERVCRNAVPKPSHTVTYFGLPKTDQLVLRDYAMFTDLMKFGGVYLNYVEIGKTITDLAQDQDQYIDDQAFKPFRHYSADFFVTLYDGDPQLVNNIRITTADYYIKNSQFFINQGLDINHPYLKPGSIQVAEIRPGYTDIVEQLATRQWVKSVQIQ
jgi:hypothetical protein